VIGFARDGWRKIMTSVKTLAAAALLSAMAATTVFAQATIQEPGSFAFYHPDLDVLNGGAPTLAGRFASDPAAMQPFQHRQSDMARAFISGPTSSRSRVAAVPRPQPSLRSEESDE
jgi:hypothetical protein